MNNSEIKLKFEKMTTAQLQSKLGQGKFNEAEANIARAIVLDRQNNKKETAPAGNKKTATAKKEVPTKKDVIVKDKDAKPATEKKEKVKKELAAPKEDKKVKEKINHAPKENGKSAVIRTLLLEVDESVDSEGKTIRIPTRHNGEVKRCVEKMIDPSTNPAANYKVYSSEVDRVANQLLRDGKISAVKQYIKAARPEKAEDTEEVKSTTEKKSKSKKGAKLAEEVSDETPVTLTVEENTAIEDLDSE